MIGKLHSVVPFPKRSGRIAVLLEKVGYRRLVQVHPLAARRSAVHPAANMMTTREKLRPGRRANRTGGEKRSNDAPSLARESRWGVDRFEFPAHAQVPPSLIIGQKTTALGLARSPPAKRITKETKKRSIIKLLRFDYRVVTTLAHPRAR